VANHKSAEKRNRQSQVRRLRNRGNRTQMKNAVRKVNEAQTQDQAKEALKLAIPVIARTASKGSLHKRTASRKISRLTKLVNKMQPAA
jgi:small subunit ribosomal protein S20